MLSDALATAARPRTWSGAADVLAVSGNPLLGVYLAGLFRPAGWKIAHRRTCAEGIAFLRECGAAVAVWEETLPDGRWEDAAREMKLLAGAPLWIVAGDDARLEREVLASGGFNVLVRPLREADVIWTVASAWHALMQRFADDAREAARCSDG